MKAKMLLDFLIESGWLVIWGEGFTMCHSPGNCFHVRIGLDFVSYDGGPEFDDENFGFRWEEEALHHLTSIGWKLQGRRRYTKRDGE